MCLAVLNMGTNKDNIICGPPLERSIHSSLGDLLLLMLRTHNEAIMQVDVATGEKLPAYLLLNRAIALAKWLQKNKMGLGDTISISSENRLEFCIVPVAAFLSGVTLAPLNPDYTLGEATHVLNLSKPKVIFCSPKTIDRIIAGRQNYPYVQKFVLFGKDRVKHKNVIMYEDIIKDAKVDSVDEEFEATPLNPDEAVAVILCSSGTTGLPKGVMTTHYNITAYIEIASIALERNMGLTAEGESEVLTGIAPFFHGMGFMIMLLTMIGGKMLVVYSKFDPKQFLQSFSKYHVTTLVVPPPIILFMVKHPMVKNYDTSNIREVKSGAAAIGKEIENEAARKLNIKYVSQNYGMTETTLGVLLPWNGNYRLGSVGQVVPGMRCKIADEHGNALGPNKEGELCFQGPLIMKGYIGNPQATADTIDKDNWLHTGDIGYYDNDGFFFIVDRIKELIKYKGFQVAPAELEALLMTHPVVADAAVVGLEDETVGELPLAFVVKKPTQNVTATELEKYIAERVSPAKRLRGGVHFIKEIPRNPTGKILRRSLRECAKKLQSKL